VRDFESDFEWDLRDSGHFGAALRWLLSAGRDPTSARAALLLTGRTLAHTQWSPTAADQRLARGAASASGRPICVFFLRLCLAWGPPFGPLLGPLDWPLDALLLVVYLAHLNWTRIC